jgi:hypothetical protein
VPISSARLDELDDDSRLRAKFAHRPRARFAEAVAAEHRIVANILPTNRGAFHTRAQTPHLFTPLSIMSLVTTLILVAASAAPSYLAPSCYLDPIWSNSSITIVSNITYGSAYNNMTREQETLLLDAYLPPSEDNRTARPVAIVVHGGGFDAGDKTWEGDVQMALALATRGFVVVRCSSLLSP